MTTFKTAFVRFVQSASFVYVLAGSLIVAGIIASMEQDPATISYLTAEERHSRNAEFLDRARRIWSEVPTAKTAEGVRRSAVEAGWLALQPNLDEGFEAARLTSDEATKAREEYRTAWFGLDGDRVLDMLNGEISPPEVMEEFADRASRIALAE